MLKGVGLFYKTNKYVIFNVIKRHASTYIVLKDMLNLYDERKSAKESKEDEDMAKVLNNKGSNKTETSNVSKLLNKGMKRYDKALEELSKN